MYTFSGDNPTTLYKEMLDKLYKEGDELSPRGKLIKELRPVSIEYTNPYNRTTFLATRRINPFFQLAESFQIISGINDAKWLSMFNANMINFSDDGKTYNAFYGERLRHWGNNSPKGVLSEKALDQLYDVYKRILEDKDTRQAMAAIGNPTFDNYEYLNVEKGRDIACNLYITFKVRNNKLHMVVFNRSNDLHWGTMGANIVQFSTIQEAMCSWLRNSGKEEFNNLELGSYHQIADSLHIYMDSYGADISEKVLNYYENNPYVEPNFETVLEPRINSSYEKFTKSLDHYWGSLDWYITKENITLADISNFMNRIALYKKQGEMDNYLAFTFKSMMCYRLIKQHKYNEAFMVLNLIDDCQFKVLMLYFLKAFINKMDDATKEEFTTKYNDLVETLVFYLKDKSQEANLREYLSLG